MNTAVSPGDTAASLGCSVMTMSAASEAPVTVSRTESEISSRPASSRTTQRYTLPSCRAIAEKRSVSLEAPNMLLSTHSPSICACH